MTDPDLTAGPLVRPSVSDACAYAEAADERADVVSLVGSCTVEYEGRGAGYLGTGDRHVLCKPDGTTLVHGAAGHGPESWHPPGATREWTVADGRLRLRSRADRGELLVRFATVRQASAFPLDEASEREVSGTEDDLRTRLLDDPAIVEPGFRPLATERETSAGAVDVYGEDADGRPVVLELKRRRTGPDAVGQLHRYVDALASDLHANADVRGVLVAPSTTPRARRLLAEHGLEFVSLAPEPGSNERG